MRARLDLGPLVLEERFTLVPSARGTRLGIRLLSRGQATTLGGVLDRVSVRRVAAELATHALRALRDCCEGRDAGADASPTPGPASGASAHGTGPAATLGG
jgi:hypothetical protein